MKSLIIIVLTMTLSFVVSVFVMRYGWGLHPQNWTIIVGGWIATVLLSFCIQAAVKQ